MSIGLEILILFLYFKQFVFVNEIILPSLNIQKENEVIIQNIWRGMDGRDKKQSKKSKRLTQISLIQQLEYKMLGIESQISISEQVSNLSISSNTGKEKNSNNVSIHNPSTLNSEGASASDQSSNLKNEKIKQLRNRMQQISRNQEALDVRMKSYISMIEKQVRKKEDQNRQLQTVVTSLKEELCESRADLEILSSYVAKKNINTSRQQPKHLRLSTQNSKGQLNPTMATKSSELAQTKTRQNNSPKTKLAEKPKSPSPVPKDLRKQIIGNTLVASPFRRKVRSPAK